MPEGERKGKDAIIAAIATVLAAVIGAAGLIISNNHRDLDALKKEVADLKMQRDRKIEESREAAPRPVLIAPTTTHSAPPSRVQEDDGFSITLEQCVRSGSVVDCTLAVVNEQEQHRMSILARPNLNADSRAFDESGRQLKADGATLAGVAGAMRVNLPANISVPATLRFRDVPALVKRFSVLELSFIGRTDFSVQFPDVTIETK